MSYSDSDRHAFFSKIVNQALRAFSALTISIVGAMPLMMEFLVDESFAEAYYYVPILLVGALGHSMVSFYSGVLIAQNRTGKVANTSITAAALSLAISLTFVHWIGLYAIAFSTPVAFFFMVIYRQVLLQRELRVKYDSRNLVLVAATIALVMVLYYLRIDPLPMLHRLFDLAGLDRAHGMVDGEAWPLEAEATKVCEPGLCSHQGQRCPGVAEHIRIKIPR